MKAQIVRGLMALVLVGLPGCVSQGTYEQTLKDLQSTKSDLDRLRVQNEALNKQVIGLKESSARLKEELDRANVQIASLKEEVGKERQAADNKVKDLDRQVKELTKGKKDLTQELEVQKQRYEDSLKTIKRQAKELKEREKSALIEPPTPQPKPAAPPADATNPQEAPTSAPNEAAPASPSSEDAKAPTNLVDINKATPADLTLTLGLAKEDSDKLVKNRPYKTIEELITKAGIAKATVDKIREKVTVGP
ncbi:MAG TPA: helix-hairpin-helix domain-containing protein [Nitrospirales bacterium]|nr:helix-hairpin-helix domain-containing protein [Nitrospirales bacterium]